jgi:hypothetical protein
MAADPSLAYLSIMTRVNAIILAAQQHDDKSVADQWARLSENVARSVK